MKKYLLLIPLFLGGLLACEKSDLHLNGTHELQEEAVAQMFAQRLVAFQDDLAQQNATHFRTLKGDTKFGSNASSPEELILELEALHLNFNPALIRLLDQSLNDIRRLELRNQNDLESFAATMDLEFQKALPQNQIKDIDLRRYETEDCRMCCIRTYDDTREEISRDLIKCMALGGVFEPAVGWSCVTKATYEIVETNIDLQNCISDI